MHDNLPSWQMMISIDFLLIALAVVGTVIVVAKWKALRQAHARLGVVLILAGFWTKVFVYIADIYTMTILPLVEGTAEAMASMIGLHLNYSWYIHTVSAVLILVGLVLTIIQFVRQIGVIEANNQALEQSEILLDSVFENVPVGILIKDSENVVERPNKTYLSWYGLTAEEMVGQRSHEIEDFQPPEDIDLMKDQEKQVLATGTSFTRQVERTFADGQRHIVEITKFPIYDRRGKISKVGSVSVELTELTEAKERAEEAHSKAELANREKSAFLANMSHELRTPLNAIIGFSETMLAQVFGPMGSEKYGEYAKAISQSGHHLLDLVNDILEMAKIESEPYELSLESFNLREVIADSFQLIQGLADKKGVELEERLTGAASLITADKRAMRQILLNLISNAVKFSREGGSVVVSATASKDDLTLCIEDAGIGIPTEDIPNLTKPFNQGSRKNTYTAGEGTGLGLSIVASLVQLHHGTLDIQSEVEKGTRVIVVLPGVLSNTERAGVAC